MSLTSDFTAAAQANGIHVIDCSDHAQAIAELQRMTQGHAVISGSAGILADAELPAPPDDPWDADCGVVMACAAAAESGTVALAMTPDNPRGPSLLVEHSIVVVPRQVIYASYQQMVDHVAALQPLPTGLQFVSGNSRSGDIESAMVQGMHGPRTLSYLVYG